MNEMSDNYPLVLLVEDIDEIRSGMKRAAEAHGFRVVEATNAEDAISVGERTSPVLILTEEQMPTFDALMERLQNHPTLLNVPVVIINPDVEDGTRYGDATMFSDYDHLEHHIAIAQNSINDK